jgi:glycosyltransferase involved in cell wall biosynthesis
VQPRKRIGKPIIGCLTSFTFIEKRLGVDKLARELDFIGFDGDFIIAGNPGAAWAPPVGRFLGGDSCAYFVGYCHDRHAFFSNIDLFLYWSELDVLPGVLLESMAAGVPIIAGGGIRSATLSKFIEATPCSSVKHAAILATKRVSDETWLETMRQSTRDMAKQLHPSTVARERLKLFEALIGD